MPIYKTFAKRKMEAENSGKPVIYRYGYLPRQFKVQVVHILRGPVSGALYNYWREIHDVLVREMGVFELVQKKPYLKEGVETICHRFILESYDVDQVLSLIELAFMTIDKAIRKEMAQAPSFRTGVRIDIDEILKELNYRFQEHAVGYQYVEGQIVEVNSQYLHSETVEPAITLLHDAGFQGALQEFMDAHKCYREKDHKNAIVNASNAFESTMKTICDARGWAYSPSATSSKLIEILFDNNLVSPEMKSHFTSLRSTLASGVPTIRNKGGQGGHGQGSQPVQVPDHVAAYALHLTASNIVFLVESHKTLDR